MASRTYDREHKATLAARAKYLRDVYTGEGSIYVLRRNVHKLEKGVKAGINAMKDDGSGGSAAGSGAAPAHP